MWKFVQLFLRKLEKKSLMEAIKIWGNSNILLKFILFFASENIEYAYVRAFLFKIPTIKIPSPYCHHKLSTIYVL